MRATLIVLALLVAGPAWAENCAKYTNDLAYNACLAAHGPRARGIPLGPAPTAREGHVGAGAGRARSRPAPPGLRQTPPRPQFDDVLGR